MIARHSRSLALPSKRRGKKREGAFGGGAGRKTGREKGFHACLWECSVH